MTKLVKLICIMLVSALALTIYPPSADAWQECGSPGDPDTACCIHNVYCCDNYGNAACLTGCREAGAPVCSTGGGGGSIDDGGGGVVCFLGPGLRWYCVDIEKI